MRSAEDNRIHVRNTRKRLHEFMRQLKAKRCTDCGVVYPPHVMQFDHVRGVKQFNLSAVSSHYVSRKRLIEEAAKCDVVCANCHADRTYRRMHQPQHFQGVA